MTIEELNIKIKEGAKKTGSRNAYLASPEYHSLYNQYLREEKRQPKQTKKVTTWKISESESMGDGFFFENEKGHYLANTGMQFGMCSGAISFKTKESAIQYALRNKIKYI